MDSGSDSIHDIDSFDDVWLKATENSKKSPSKNKINTSIESNYGTLEKTVSPMKHSVTREFQPNKKKSSYISSIMIFSIQKITFSKLIYNA